MPEDAVSETPDERADRLVKIGLDVADRIRDEDPTAVARSLDGLDRTEMRDLVVLLAAAVDVSVGPSVLFGWFRPHSYKANRDAGRDPSTGIPCTCGLPQRNRIHHLSEVMKRAA